MEALSIHEESRAAVGLGSQCFSAPVNPGVAFGSAEDVGQRTAVLFFVRETQLQGALSEGGSGARKG